MRKQARSCPESPSNRSSVLFVCCPNADAALGHPRADGSLPRRHNEHPQALRGGHLEHDQRGTGGARRWQRGGEYSHAPGEKKHDNNYCCSANSRRFGILSEAITLFTTIQVVLV